jgi:hypothetical protein
MTNSTVKNVCKIQVLQNKLLKLALKLDRLTPTNIVHKKLRILKVTDIQKLKLVCFVNNCLNGNCPPPFYNYFTWRNLTYNLRDETLHIMRSHTVIGSSASQISAAKLWNSLPDFIKIHRYQLNFKKIVAQHLIEQYN